MAVSVSFGPAGFRSTRARLPFSLAIWMAAARPRPEPAPVMMMVLSSSLCVYGIPGDQFSGDDPRYIPKHIYPSKYSCVTCGDTVLSGICRWPRRCSTVDFRTRSTVFRHASHRPIRVALDGTCTKKCSARGRSRGHCTTDPHRRIGCSESLNQAVAFLGSSAWICAKNSASSSVALSGRTLATYWSGRTTTMTPSRERPRTSKMSLPSTTP